MSNPAGAGAVKGNLRALNQSVSSQVALLMKNPTKLARRTGVSAEQRPRVLCQPAKPVAESSTGKQSATAGTLASPAGEEEEQDLEAFDDGEFYAQLLKEFLDSSGGAVGVAGSALYPQVVPSVSCHGAHQITQNLLTSRLLRKVSETILENSSKTPLWHSSSQSQNNSCPTNLL